MTKRNSSGQEEVTSFEYDPQGNLLKDAKAKYTYDSFNRLQKAEAFSGQVQINRYDAEGLRHEIEENSKLVQFIYSDRELIAETNTNGDLTRYIRGLGLISSDIDKAKTYYHYCSDELGSITHILDEEGKTLNHYEYDAFGNTTISEETVDNRFRYTGEQYDKVTEQYYLRARYYNPIIGRFLQEDSYYNDGLNLYAYCESNPVRYIDPSGYTKVDAHDKLNGDQQALYDIVDETNKKGRASFEEKDIIYECADEYDVDRNQLGLEDQKLLEGPVAETPSSNPSQGDTQTGTLLPGEGDVGTYKDLIKSGSRGDNLTPHHMPSAEYMESYGVPKNNGVSMNMEQPSPGVGGRHRQTRSYGRGSDLTEIPRDALARDLMDARRIYQNDGLYTPEIRKSLQEVLEMNKLLYPEIFNK